MKSVIGQVYWPYSKALFWEMGGQRVRATEINVKLRAWEAIKTSEMWHFLRTEYEVAWQQRSEFLRTMGVRWDWVEFGETTWWDDGMKWRI